MQNSGLDPTLLMVLSILALVIILVVLVVCAVVAFRYHFIVAVDVAVVVVDGDVHPLPGHHPGCPCCLRCCCVQVFLCHDPHIPPITMMLFIKLLGAVIWREK